MMGRMDRRQLLGAAGIGAVAFVLTRVPASAAPAKFPVNLSDSEWRRRLGPQRYAVLREAATERPFSSPLDEEHRKGLYSCAGCALPLFPSSTKFDSGTGWPSFWAPLKGATVTRSDHSLMMDRTEVLCRRCGGHLGHVFDDGPKPTGLRYCMNGLALNFRPA
jgi:peptide-methionine (R)-S-oxide reductase